MVQSQLLFLPIHLTIFLLSFLFAFDENIYDRMDDRSNDIVCDAFMVRAAGPTLALPCR
jgi:hypothetical protein